MAPNTPKSDLSDDGETLLSPSEVASLDNVSTKTVLRWIEKGLLPAYKQTGQSGIGRKSQCAIEPLSALARLLARKAASDHFHQQTSEGKYGTEYIEE